MYPAWTQRTASFWDVIQKNGPDPWASNCWTGGIWNFEVETSHDSRIWDSLFSNLNLWEATITLHMGQVGVPEANKHLSNTPNSQSEHLEMWVLSQADCRFQPEGFPQTEGESPHFSTRDSWLCGFSLRELATAICVYIYIYTYYVISLSLSLSLSLYIYIHIYIYIYIYMIFSFPPRWSELTPPWHTWCCQRSRGVHADPQIRSWRILPVSLLSSGPVHGCFFCKRWTFSKWEESPEKAPGTS